MLLRNAADYLERSAARVPDKTAFSDASGAVSYSRMLHDAQALGTVLSAVPGCCNAPVAVMIGRTVKSLTAMQGVLQSGNYYVPLDEQMPEARMRRILDQVRARAIVYTEQNRAAAEKLADCAPLISLDEAVTHEPDPALLHARREEILDIDPVYVLFTSGSTGAPKGIVISHRAILDFTAWMTDFCGYTEHEIFGNQAPFYFDLSGKDVYQTLSLGASCHIFEKKYFTFPMLLLKAMEEQGVTAINWATSAFHLVAASGALTKYAPTHLKKAALGGEALQARYVNLWKAAVPGLQVVNMYGPTETTIDCAAMHLTREYRDDEPIPIGQACRNKQILLLKDDLTPAAPGESGEICVRGSGLAAGYFADPEKTDAAFIQNPLCSDFRDILYRTGDMAVQKEDGYLYFLARRDGQIKHMGYRIELGEIEVALHSVAGMQAAACLYDGARDRILCVYAGEPEADALAKTLRTLLPKYMLPNLYEKLERLPYNANGKIDRVALKERFLHAEG